MLTPAEIHFRADVVNLLKNTKLKNGANLAKIAVKNEPAYARQPSDEEISMTNPTTQARLARPIGSTVDLNRTLAVVFFFFLCQIVAAVFDHSVAYSQAYSQAPSLQQPLPTDAGTQQAPKFAEQRAEETVTLNSSAVLHAEPQNQETHWRPLLDKKLSHWEVFTGVPHKTVTIDGFPQSNSHDCRKGKPFGLGDPKNIYSVKITNGAPVLHVSGELYAGLTSREEFENYHFSTEFKWGKKKWHPRKKMKRDSGILLHCNGKHGAFWNVWMRCFECQIQEGDFGDFIQLAGTSCQVRVTSESESKAIPQHSPNGNWRTIGPGVRKWGAKRFGNHEISADWNRIEVYAVGDKSVFAVNGHPVMHLKDMRVGKFEAAKPLTGGKIQVQSEAAECWYRDMKIRPIGQLPAKFAAHFDDH